MRRPKETRDVCVIPIGSKAESLNIIGSAYVWGETANIEASEDALIYGVVKGDVKAKRITVLGEVTGSLRAVTITLGETAKVAGEIWGASLVISKGAKMSNKIYVGCENVPD